MRGEPLNAIRCAIPADAVSTIADAADLVRPQPRFARTGVCTAIRDKQATALDHRARHG